MPYRRLPVAHVCPDLVPGHELRVTEIVLEELVAGQSVLRIEYTITPPLPAPGRGPTVAAWPVVWDVTRVTDDQGATYTEGGGAYGLAPEGDSTTGTLRLSPAPPAAARRLRIVLHPWFPWSGPWEAARACTVEVDLSAGRA